jgi:hypothetical protein
MWNYDRKSARMVNVQRLKTRGASGRVHLRWEGRAMTVKMRGTLGTVGTLARFLGKYERFSRVPKNANGTLVTRKASRCRLSAFGCRFEDVDVVEVLEAVDGLVNFAGNFAVWAARRVEVVDGLEGLEGLDGVEVLEVLAKFTGDFDGLTPEEGRFHNRPTFRGFACR